MNLGIQLHRVDELELLSRLRQERPKGGPDNLFLAVFLTFPFEEIAVVFLLTNSSSVRQEVADFDFAPFPGHPRKEIREAIIEADLAILDEQHDCGGGELFGNGSKRIQCRRGARASNSTLAFP